MSGKPLTLDEVKQRTENVLQLDRADGDPEQAHAAQDDLYVDVLRAVTAGHPDSARMAQECLRIKEANGTRWYA